MRDRQEKAEGSSKGLKWLVKPPEANQKKETQIKAKLFARIFRSQCSGTSPNVRRGFSQAVIKLDVDDNLTRQDIRCGGLSASLRSTEIGAKSQQQISQSLAKWQPGQI